MKNQFIKNGMKKQVYPSTLILKEISDLKQLLFAQKNGLEAISLLEKEKLVEQ